MPQAPETRGRFEEAPGPTKADGPGERRSRGGQGQGRRGVALGGRRNTSTCAPAARVATTDGRGEPGQHCPGSGLRALLGGGRDEDEEGGERPRRASLRVYARTSGRTRRTEPGQPALALDSRRSSEEGSRRTRRTKEERRTAHAGRLGPAPRQPDTSAEGQRALGATNRLSRTSRPVWTSIRTTKGASKTRARGPSKAKRESGEPGATAEGEGGETDQTRGTGGPTDGGGEARGKKGGHHTTRARKGTEREGGGAEEPRTGSRRRGKKAHAQRQGREGGACSPGARGGEEEETRRRRREREGEQADQQASQPSPRHHIDSVEPALAIAVHVESHMLPLLRAVPLGAVHEDPLAAELPGGAADDEAVARTHPRQNA